MADTITGWGISLGTCTFVASSIVFVSDGTLDLTSTPVYTGFAAAGVARICARLRTPQNQDDQKGPDPQ